MPLKIPPFTPVAVQPTSAEPYSVFVPNTPPARLPLAGTELVALVQNGGSVHTALDNVSTPLPPIRTILTAAITNYYVTTTGSDSNDGSLAHPWATILHAVTVLAETLDFAGNSVVINIGAGTFAGVSFATSGVPGMTGGGTLEFLGAGSANTIIDCTLDPGADGFDFMVPQTCAIAFDKMTIKKDGFACVFAAVPLTLYLYDIVNGTPADLKFAPGQRAIILDAPGTMFIGNNGGTYTFDGTFFPSGNSGIEASFGSSVQDFGPWTFTNNPAFATLMTGSSPGGFIVPDFGSCYVSFAQTFHGSATGTIYAALDGGIIVADTATVIPAGMTFAEADSSGLLSLSTSSVVSGAIGLAQRTTAPNTTGLRAGTWTISKNTNQPTAGAGMALYANDAGTIIPLTTIVTTFANLPASPQVGFTAAITDGLAGNCADGTCTTWGTNVTGGGGALKLLLWYNGAHWTLAGK